MILILLKIKNNYDLFRRIEDLYIKEKLDLMHNYTPPEFEFFYEDKTQKKLSINRKSNLHILNYIYHPAFSKKVRCCAVNIDNVLIKFFMLQNKFFFKLRILVLKILRSTLNLFKNT